MTSVSTVSRGSDEMPAITATMVTAFAADPFLRWLFPRPDQYLTAAPLVLRFFAGASFDSETAYYSDAFSGAALWLAPGIAPDEEGLGQVLLEHVDEAMHEQVFAVMEQVGIGHPEAPHWYLPIMGVDPVYQGKGVGSALLQHSLAACDRACPLAYLEATNPANVPFYQRHGFLVLDEIQVDGSPVLTRMLREAA